MPNKKIILISILILAILLGACGGSGGDGQDTVTAENDALNDTDSDVDSSHTMIVNGRGVVTLSPDFASISIGVQTEGASASEAVTANNEKAQLVMDALAEFNIRGDDVSTTNFSVYPIQQRNSSGDVTSTTFRVQNTVNVTVDEIDDLGEILDAVVTAGANTIYGISFEVEPGDESAAYDQALAAAMQDAHSQAIILALAAGVELADVQTISVSSSPGIVEPFAELAFDTSGLGASVPISPGQTEVSVNVYVVYEIRAQVEEVEDSTEAEATEAPSE